MRKAVVLVMVFGAMLASASVLAQEGGVLPPDEAAMIRRAAAAVTSRQDFRTYAVHTRQVSEQTLSVSSLGRTITGYERVACEATATIIQGENRNILATVTADVSGLDASTSQPFTYALSAEVRLVDGRLYVLAERDTNMRTGLPSMPQGWIVIDDPADWPALNALDLDRFLTEDSGGTLFDFPDLLLDHASAATLSSAGGADSALEETITIGLNGEQALSALRDLARLRADDDDVPAPYDAAGADATMRLTATMGPGDQLLAYGGETRIAWNDLDLNVLDPEIPSGAARATIQLAVTASNRFSRINEDIAPVGAPNPGW